MNRNKLTKHYCDTTQTLATILECGEFVRVTLETAKHIRVPKLVLVPTGRKATPCAR